MTTDAKETIALDKKHVWHAVTQHKLYETTDPVIFTEGQGLHMKDVNGKEYIDALSGGVWTVNVGYGRKEIAQATAEQMEKFCFYGAQFGNVPSGILAEKIIEKMPGFSRAYFSTSGSDSNEKTFKIVRQISELRYGGKKYKILYRDRDYHGTTITTLSAGGHGERNMQYGPFTPGFVEFPAVNPYRNPFGLDKDDPALGKKYAEQLEEVILREGPDTVGGIIIETITAGGGALVPPPDYLKHVSDICKKYDILLIMDEVVMGFGRTGKWFGFQHYGITPDMVTLGKGIASGYVSLSCTMTTEEVFKEFLADPADLISYFRDISTFSGVTGGLAAGIANIKILEEEKLVENAEIMGKYLMNLLNELKNKHTCIGDVRGLGLYTGIELVVDRTTKEPMAEAVCAKIVSECMKNGVVIGRTSRCIPGYNNTLCIAPSLIVTEKDLDAIVSTVDLAIKEVLG